ncbi:hypothetical protein [Virgibacillus sediminis]|uniref:Uncharacterized protein n=1 Tax=Virgibacillus sediminis TaxID=202260 RepID=A0ABV7A832_9BACI
MKKYYKDSDEYDFLLAVEKDHKDDFYYLVGGVDRYYFLVNHTNRKEAPCIVEEGSATTGVRNLKLLRRLFNKGDTGKENKLTLLNLLNKGNTKLLEIVRKTGFTTSKIRNEYEFHEDIDSEWITDYTAIKTANWIIGLKLNKKLKNFYLNELDYLKITYSASPMKV